MVIHNFQESLERGKIGERVFIDMLKKGGIHEVKDVSNDRSYQSKGIDFIVNGYTVDVKTDFMAAKTGNIAFETDSVSINGETIKKGWLYTSEAQYYFYLVPEGNNKSYKIICLTKEDIFNLIEEHSSGQRFVKNMGYRSTVELVKIRDCLQGATSTLSYNPERTSENDIQFFLIGIFE